MLTPQLQQAIKLLQLSTLEINQETARLLDENPFLEREDDIDQPDIQRQWQHGRPCASRQRRKQHPDRDRITQGR